MTPPTTLRSVIIGACLIAMSGHLGCRAEAPRRVEVEILPPLELDEQATVEAVEALASDPNLTRRFMLIMRNTHVGDRGIAALARSPYLDGITHLRLADAAMTNAGLGALSAARSLRPHRLELAGAGFDHQGLTTLLASPTMSAVNRLVISRAFIGDAGAVALSESPVAEQLVGLELLRGGLTDAGLTALLSSTRLGLLEHLTLISLEAGWSSTPFRALADPQHLPRLQTVVIVGLDLDRKIEADILAARPNLQIFCGVPSE